VKLLEYRGLKVGLVMLVAAGLAMAARPREHISESKEKISLETMVPKQFSNWRVDTSLTSVKLSPVLQAEVAKTYDQTLSRTYVNSQGQHIMLSLAYGSNQNSSMQIHRPEVCYPAQGFKVSGERMAEILLDYGRLPIKRLFASQGARNEPITYWLVVGDSVTTFGLEHRLATLKYGLTGHIPDGMLVRVSSLGIDADAAYQLQENFIKTMLAALNEKDRVRLLGTFGA
jgi:EpsI family protein